MARRGRYPAEVRERAVRMVFEHEREYESQWAAITSIAGKLGMTNETLRKWVRQAEVDGGAWPGVSSVEAEHVKELGVLAAPTIGGTPVVLALDVADAEAAFAQAVAAGLRSVSRSRTRSGATCTANSTIHSGFVGTSANTCATCRTTKSWPPPRARSPELRLA